eukprot:m.56842 g.56842  ORF g.56842 m.56842 type:complete len:210 (-) comp22302_c0_seq1:29-658(-)
MSDAEMDTAADENAAVFVCPGQRLADAAQVKAGSGTYERNGKVYASIVGKRELLSYANESKLVLEVVSKHRQRVLQVGSLVACKITSITPRYAKVDIQILITANGTKIPLKDPFRGMIRTQDIRETEKDKVVLYKCFRPGDIVTAKVISLGDAKSYYLSTAEDTLGVVYAESEGGQPLVPVSWTEMQCVETGVKEPRKVASQDKPRGVV